MLDGKLGVAIHGAGWVAGAHAASWNKNPHVEIVSVSDVDASRARRFAEEIGCDCTTGDDYGRVLADERVDIVDVTSPSHLHTEHGIAAAQARKHVLVEKPMALTMDENRALRDAVAKAGVKSISSFVLRWNPACQTIKSLAESGALGDLFYVETDYWHGLHPTHHAWNLHSKKKTGGSAMLLGGCHAVDALRWLTGDEVEEVTAVSNNTKGLFEYDANVVAVVKFAGGSSARRRPSSIARCPMRSPSIWPAPRAPSATTGYGPKALSGADGLDEMPHDFARLGRRASPCLRRRDQPLRRLHKRGSRIALQHCGRLSDTRVVHGNRPFDRARGAAGTATANLTDSILVTLRRDAPRIRHAPP